MVEWTILNTEKKCLLCTETRALDRAHILPKRFTSKVRLDSNEALFANNVILLCSTHHRLFDRGLLNTEEMATLKPLVERYVDFAEHICDNTGFEYQIHIPPKTHREVRTYREAIKAGEAQFLLWKERLRVYIQRTKVLYSI